MQVTFGGRGGGDTAQECCNASLVGAKHTSYIHCEDTPEWHLQMPFAIQKPARWSSPRVVTARACVGTSMNPRKATSPAPDGAHVCDPPAIHPVPLLQDQPPSRLRRNFLQAIMIIMIIIYRRSS